MRKGSCLAVVMPGSVAPTSDGRTWCRVAVVWCQGARVARGTLRPQARNYGCYCWKQPHSACQHTQRTCTPTPPHTPCHRAGPAAAAPSPAALAAQSHPRRPSSERLLLLLLCCAPGQERLAFYSREPARAAAAVGSTSDAAACAHRGGEHASMTPHGCDAVVIRR
jgi:hypothetical protein